MVAELKDWELVRGVLLSEKMLVDRYFDGINVQILAMGDKPFTVYWEKEVEGRAMSFDQLLINPKNSNQAIVITRKNHLNIYRRI